MRKTSLVWTVGLLLALGLLAGIAAWMRGGAEEATRRRSAAVAATTPDPGEVPTVASAEPEPPAEAPSRLQEFQEAGTALWEAALSGQVLTPQGPQEGMLVKVEWVAAFHPGVEEAVRLKRAGARRDREGVWWWRANAVTDGGGYFSVEGLPAVPLKVRAGGRTQIAHPGSSVLLRTGNP
jgi:hypothetical protein